MFISPRESNKEEGEGGGREKRMNEREREVGRVKGKRI